MTQSVNRVAGAIAVVAAVLALAACGGNGYEREVALEAHWQCDVQHRSYSDLTDMGDDLATRLSSEGISADRYAAFKVDLENSTTLRSDVLRAYDAYCGSPVDD